MKILKGLLYSIAGLLILLCIFVVVCAFRPNLSERIAGFLYPERDRNVRTEIDGSSPETEAAADGRESLGEETEFPAGGQSEEEPAGKAEPSENVSGVEEGIASDYVPPKQSEITVPEKVSGKNGYRQIEEEKEQVDEAAAREIESRLGTGNTGDDLEFDPLYYPYYAMLNGKGQHVYRQIYANANELCREFVPVESVTAGELKNIFAAVYNDHPELFWLETAYAAKFTGNGRCIEIDLKCNRTAEDLENERRLFEESAGGILLTAQSLPDDYEKEKFVHDALADRISYDLGAEMNQSAYSAVVNSRTVCAGYARAFQYLMQRLGIPCYYCTGYAGESHAWNIIRLEDGCYNVDVTWDDTGEGTYDYFNKTDADYADSHMRQELSVYLPSCDGQLYRGLEPEGEGLRSLEDAGMAEAQVLTDMEEYYADCLAQILQNGRGSYTFYNVIEGKELFEQWYRDYQTQRYRQAYMREALEKTGAVSCEITLETEELQGGRYLIRHDVSIE